MRELARRPWDWLRELIARQRALPAIAPVRSPVALHDAIARLGLDDAAIVEGLAAALGIDRSEVEAPHEGALGRVVAEDLALLLPPLCEHGSARMRGVAARWLALPEVIYAVPIDRAERWLCDHPAIAELLAPRVASEGLAWLGPEALARLTIAGATARVRELAASWHVRLQPEHAP